jgi:hypothetical protein
MAGASVAAGAAAGVATGAASWANKLPAINTVVSSSRVRNLFICLSVVFLILSLYSAFTLFFGANADRFVDVGNEDLAIADLAGFGGTDDRADGSIDSIIGDDHFDFDLGQEIDGVFAAAIDFGVALLTAKPFDFTDRHSLDANVSEGVLNFFEFEGLDYGFDFLHMRLSCLR